MPSLVGGNTCPLWQVSTPRVGSRRGVPRMKIPALSHQHSALPAGVPQRQRQPGGSDATLARSLLFSRTPRKHSFFNIFPF